MELAGVIRRVITGNLQKPWTAKAPCAYCKDWVPVRQLFKVEMKTQPDRWSSPICSACLTLIIWQRIFDKEEG